MKNVSAAVATVGAAAAALVLAGAGTAFAWKPDDAVLTVGCSPDAAHVEVVLGNNYKSKGEYTLTRIGSDETYTGTVAGHGTVKLVVGYTGNGDTWRYQLADTHIEKRISGVPLCNTPAPPTPSVTPSTPPVSPAPSISTSASTPASASASPEKPKLAATGGGGHGGLIAATGGGAVLLGAGMLVAARRAGRHSG